MPMTITPNIESNPHWDAQAVFDATDQGLFQGLGSGLVSGGAITPTATPSYAVNVAVAQIVVNNAGVTTQTGVALAPAPPNITDRKDIILVGPNGIPYFKAGTPCPVANWTQNSPYLPPVKPPVDANTVLMGEIYIVGNAAPPYGPITINEIVAKGVSPVPQVPFLDGRYLPGTNDVVANVVPPTTGVWSSAQSPQVDSGPTFAAAFADAIASQAADPTGATTIHRGRRTIDLPAGAYYTTQPLSLMTAGGSRAFGVKYKGAGTGITEVYYQPSVGNPRLIANCSMTSGSSTLTDPGASFTSADVGHRVVVYGAGPGGPVAAGGQLDTVILALLSPTTVTVGTTASQSAAGTYVSISDEAPLLFNDDKWAFAEFEGIDFIGLQPTGSIPSVAIPSGSMGVTVTDGAMLSGSAVLTSVSAPFTQDMVGSTITVTGAGAGGSLLTTTIVGLNTFDLGTSNGKNSITLAASNASGGNVTGATVSVLTNILTLHRVVSDAGIASASNVLNSATANFTTADLGTNIGVVGAGAGGGFLRTTIQNILSSTQVVVANLAGTTVTGAQLTLAGKTLTGKHIGNSVSVAGAGPAGGALVATVCSIRCGDVNGVMTTELVLGTSAGPSACSAPVIGVTSTFNLCANAVFWRSFSNGGVVGPVCKSVTWRGAWARVFHLDGNNQNADINFYSCNLFDRPGTFMHLTPDPALLTSAGSDQQLEYDWFGGIWAPTYGDFVFFDGRGGNLQTFGGSWTIGVVTATTVDDGGTLPVATAGTVNDPGGTWFKLRDRVAIRNHRALHVERARYEQRNIYCLIRDTEWSLGQITFVNCSDDSNQVTGASTVFSRTGLMNTTGPSCLDLNCSWKGRHLVRYPITSYRYQHSIAYSGCHFIEQPTAKDFLVTAPVAQTGGFATVSVPCVQFRGDCKNSNQLGGIVGFEDVVDCSLNWQWSSYAVFQRRWSKFIDQSIPGIPGIGFPAQINVPFDVVITKLRVHVPLVTTGSVNTDWTITITDNTTGSPVVIHTFQAGQDGVPGGTTWRGGIDAEFTVPFFQCSSLDPGLANPDQHRQLILTVGGTGTTNAPLGWVAVEMMG